MQLNIQNLQGSLAKNFRQDGKFFPASSTVHLCLKQKKELLKWNRISQGYREDKSSTFLSFHSILFVI